MYNSRISPSLFFCSFVLLTLFVACDLGDTNDEKLVLPSYVHSLIVTSRAPAFVAKASWHNGCGRFERADISRKDSIYSIRIFGSQKKNAVCTQAPIEYDAPASFSPILERGTYTFKFWRSDTTSLDTTLAL